MLWFDIYDDDAAAVGMCRQAAPHGVDRRRAERVIEVAQQVSGRRLEPRGVGVDQLDRTGLDHLERQSCEVARRGVVQLAGKFDADHGFEGQPGSDKDNPAFA